MHCPRLADCHRISHAAISWRRQGGQAGCDGLTPTAACCPAGGFDTASHTPGIAVLPTRAFVATAANPRRRCVHSPPPVDSAKHVWVNLALAQPLPTSIVALTVRESRTNSVTSGYTCHLRCGLPFTSAGAYCPSPSGMGSRARHLWTPGSMTGAAEFAVQRGEQGHLRIGAPHARRCCCHAPRRVQAGAPRSRADNAAVLGMAHGVVWCYQSVPRAMGRSPLRRIARLTGLSRLLIRVAALRVGGPLMERPPLCVDGQGTLGQLLPHARLQGGPRWLVSRALGIGEIVIT